MRQSQIKLPSKPNKTTAETGRFKPDCRSEVSSPAFGNAKDYRLALPTIGTWLAAVVLPYFSALSVARIYFLTLFIFISAAGFLLWQTLFGTWQTSWREPSLAALIVLTVGGVLAVNASVAQINRVYSQDALIRAWQGGQSQFLVTAKVVDQPRWVEGKTGSSRNRLLVKTLPNQRRLMFRLQLLRAGYPGVKEFRTNQHLTVFVTAWPELLPGTRFRAHCRLPAVKQLRASRPKQRSGAEKTDLIIRADTFYGQLRGSCFAKPQIIELPQGWQAWRNRSKTKITGLMSGSQYLHTIGPALILGNRNLPADLAQNLKTAGLIHLVCISGLHVSILLGGLELCCSFLPDRLRILVCLMALAGYCWYVGLSPPILRAALMGTIYLLAYGLNRPSQAFSALQIAVIGILVYSPAQGRELGFYLSVAATAAIILGSKSFSDYRFSSLFFGLAGRGRQFGKAYLGSGKQHSFCRKYLKKPLKKLLLKAKSVVIVTVLAQLAALPLLVMIRPVLPTYSVLANLACAPVVACLIGGCALCGLASFCSESLARALAIGLEPLAWWVVKSAESVSHLPGASLPWLPGVGGAVILILVELALLYLLWWGKRK